MERVPVALQHNAACSTGNVLTRVKPTAVVKDVREHSASASQSFQEAPHGAVRGLCRGCMMGPRLRFDHHNNLGFLRTITDRNGRERACLARCRTQAFELFTQERYMRRRLCRTYRIANYERHRCFIGTALQRLVGAHDILRPAVSVDLRSPLALGGVDACRSRRRNGGNPRARRGSDGDRLHRGVWRS